MKKTWGTPKIVKLGDVEKLTLQFKVKHAGPGDDVILIPPQPLSDV